MYCQTRHLCLTVKLLGGQEFDCDRSPFRSRNMRTPSSRVTMLILLLRNHDNERKAHLRRQIIFLFLQLIADGVYIRK